MIYKYTTMSENSTQVQTKPKKIKIKKKNKSKFTVVETFVGCGGSHIGFEREKFHTIFVNDIWDTALKTLKINNSNLSDDKIICEDINSLCKKDLLSQFKMKLNELDVLIGGVVCKGFSLAGVRNPYDDRNYLYISQLKLVEKFRPKVSIIENVPGMKNMKILCKNNYAPVSNKLKFTISDSIEIICKEINNNIEQHKKNRGAIIAINKKISNESTEELLKSKENLLIEKNELEKQRKEMENKLSKYMYCVLDDIIERYDELGYKVSINKLKVSNYGGYTNRIRLIIVAVRNDIKKEWEWPKFMNCDKDENLPNLNTVKDAFNLLDDTLNDPLNDVENRPMNHRESTIEKFKKITCEKKSEGFSSRGTSNRLSLDKPAPTLVPGHSSFQIHPIEHRSITVREGATISGFPIDYKFVGSHSDRCMQIGNAIPVQLGEILAKCARKVLE
jgi:DNA (cytosine-5)-methyltransferase 1